MPAMTARISVTLFNDPACPWGYSAIPALRTLEWRYGDQLDWRLVLIGLTESAQRQELSGEPAVLLVAPQIRHTLARFMRATVPSMHVLAWNEIPDNRKVRLVTAVGR